MPHYNDPSVVQLARDLRQTSSLSYKKIAAELESKGHVNKFGKRFSLDSIRHIVNGPRPNAKRPPSIFSRTLVSLLGDSH